MVNFAPLIVKMFNLKVIIRKMCHQVSCEKSLNLLKQRRIVNKADRRSYGCADFDETEYYFENGLRKVYPYYYKHSTFCKGRWIKKKLIDVYCNEFAIYPREVYENRIMNGALQINGQTVPIDYVLKNADHLTSVVHRHELAVLDTQIEILYENENTLVINKPASIPVHPCGLYRHNSVLFLLAKEHNIKNIYLIHRLDRLTSGVLIFAKTIQKAQELHNEMNVHSLNKEYVCMVEGDFPDGTVVCNKPLKQFYHKMGVSLVHPIGKTCSTQFEKLSYNGKSSIVLCKPATGRTHQIRVHLQYLGYPIVNDPLYNSDVFGPNKGKDGNMDKTIDCLLQDLQIEHCSQWWLEENKKHFGMDMDGTLLAQVRKWGLNSFDSSNSINLLHRKTKDPTKFSYDEDCNFCKYTYRDPKQTDLVMFLHALRYHGQDWEFKTQLPPWASNRAIDFECDEPL